MKDQLIQMEKEEQELRFSAFTNETALQVGLAIIDEARSLGKSITVEIYRQGQRLFAHAMAGTTVENEDWIRRKNNVVRHYGQSSWRVALQARQEGTTIEERDGLPLSDYVGAGGGFPLHVEGEGMIGTITVSGLPDQEDHDLLISALRRYLKL
ncbi:MULTISPECIES: heme-degrading domain-containing protein [Paenibacillus]|uniref:heme-degrading domain-containing protein n=1 Tax=Paenibacillus TaxID=44249 RepID=UPI002040D904|nr:heme-degrading domain-containing protein [Paenibacillus camelliae]MCM3634952.1 heme-degrading domain-containing protein [Paenibacillus camelliae]